MKTLFAAAALLVVVSGCVAPQPAGFDEATVVSVAHYEGSFAETWQGCDSGAFLGGACAVTGGTLIEDRADGNQWYCKARPASASGVSLTITTYCATDKVVSHQ
jgi:hypothetical protein